MSDPYHYYRTHVINGESFLVAGGEDHATGKEEDTNAPFERLEKYLSAYFQIGGISKKWSSQYFDPADGLAYIGHLPAAADNIFVACGFAGNGMTYSHITASLLTRLVKKEEHDASALFSPSRIKPATALKNEIASGVSVLTSFIGDRVKIDRIVNESEIPRARESWLKRMATAWPSITTSRANFTHPAPSAPIFSASSSGTTPREAGIVPATGQGIIQTGK